MIDRELAIQWAIDARFLATDPSGFYDLFGANSHAIQALITRAQAEAFEQAAQLCDHLSKHANHPDDINGYGCAAELRKLKESK